MKKRHRLHAVHKKRLYSSASNTSCPLVDNSQDVDLIAAKAKLMQDVFGFSNEDITQFFEQAIALLHGHRYEDAIAAFQFLTQVNPYVCDFWLGLGAAHQAIGHYQEALSWYMVAETMDPVRIDTYGYAVDACLEMHDIKQAKAILGIGYAYAKGHSRQEGVRALKAGLAELKARIMHV